MEAAGQRFALDQKVDLEAGQQDFVEHPDDQLGLTDGKAPHGRTATVSGRAWVINAKH
jgi:hypothetical protein